MAWLWQQGPDRTTLHGKTPRALLFTLDALILTILAVGSTYGARTISRLRRQVAEARQLGQYRLGRLLGAGGMGEVYLAEHLLLKRPCAVKLIRPAEATDPRHWNGSSARSASPPRSRTRTSSRSTTTAGPRTAPTTTSWSTCPA